jgi:hypothetical protein
MEEDALGCTCSVRDEYENVYKILVKIPEMITWSTYA